MASILVVADDLTGGNATGALFARRGMRVVTITADAVPPRDVDVLVVNTDTRRADPADAAVAVTNVVRAALPRPILLAKRIDTMLRGPVAAELAAALRAWEAGARGGVCAVAVPAYPGAGRTTVGGIHLVDGVPLTEGAAASDPFTAATESRVGRVLTRGTGLAWREIHLDTIRAGTDATVAAMRAALSGPGHAGGSGLVLIMDAETEEDLRVCATATAKLAHEGRDVVAVDPGPFSSALSSAKQLHPSGDTPAPILLAVASPAELTATQLTRAQVDLGAVVVDVSPDEAEPSTLMARLEGAVKSAASTGQVVAAGWRLTSGPPLATDAADDLVDTLAAAVAGAVASGQARAVFASGGDMAAATVRALDATGFTVELEVRPLVVAGRLTGGPYEGLPLATKGGLIGSNDAIVAALTQLGVMSTRDGRHGWATDHCSR